MIRTPQQRYGFIHDQRLPEVERRTAREQKMLEKEMSRVEKWLVMIKEKDKWLKSKKMSERVWKVKSELLSVSRPCSGSGNTPESERRGLEATARRGEDEE